MAETALDIAHAAMADGTEADRLRFYDRLADAELFVLLASEPQGDQIEPATFEVEDGTFILTFDREERLTQFVGRPAPYAALSGRLVAEMLAGQGVGLGLNLDIAPSSILIPAEAVDWLNEALANRPAQINAQPLEIAAPGELPEALLTALDAKLATAAGYARMAYLVAVTYAPARPGHLLVFIDAIPAAQAALSQAVGEALIFSGLDAGEIDVGFFDTANPVAAKLARVGLRFDLPEPEISVIHPSAPGTDPENPPKLR